MASVLYIATSFNFLIGAAVGALILEVAGACYLLVLAQWYFLGFVVVCALWAR